MASPFLGECTPSPYRRTAAAFFGICCGILEEGAAYGCIIRAQRQLISYTVNKEFWLLLPATAKNSGTDTFSN
jgi:hypothetical protein